MIASEKPFCVHVYDHSSDSGKIKTHIFYVILKSIQRKRKLPFLCSLTPLFSGMMEDYSK